MFINGVNQDLCLIGKKRKALDMFEEDPAALIDNEVTPVGDFMILVKRAIGLGGFPSGIHKKGDLAEAVFRYELLM